MLPSILSPLSQLFARPDVGDGDKEKSHRTNQKDQVLHRVQLLAARLAASRRTPMGSTTGEGSSFAVSISSVEDAG